MRTYLICRTRVDARSFVRWTEDAGELAALAAAVEDATKSVKGTYVPPPSGGSDKCAEFRVHDVGRNGDDFYVVLVRAVPLH